MTRYIGNHPSLANDPSGLFEPLTVTVVVGHNSSVVSMLGDMSKQGNAVAPNAYCLGIACGMELPDSKFGDINTFLLQDMNLPVPNIRPPLPLTVFRPLGPGGDITYVARDTSQGFGDYCIPQFNCQMWNALYTKQMSTQYGKAYAQLPPIPTGASQQDNQKAMQPYYDLLMKTHVLYALDLGHSLLGNKKLSDKSDVTVTFKLLEKGASSFTSPQEFITDVWGDQFYKDIVAGVPIGFGSDNYSADAKLVNVQKNFYYSIIKADLVWTFSKNGNGQIGAPPSMPNPIPGTGSNK